MPSEVQARISDTIKYLGDHGLDPDGATSVQAKTKPEKWLGPLLSIGGIRGLKIFQSDAKTQQRRALRGLLLTALVRANMPEGEVPRLKQDFSEQPESLLRSQILWLATHARTTDLDARIDAAVLALAAAGTAFPTGNQFGCTKWDFAKNRPAQGLNCYGAVLYWLFMSGAFSHRWLLPLMKNSAQAAINKAVTGGRHTSSMDQLSHATDGGTGRVILAYRPGFPLAHVMIADGKGNFVSNNTPSENCPKELLNDLTDCTGVFAGIDRTALRGHGPIKITFEQLKALVALRPKGSYQGHAVLSSPPWEGKASWDR
jgi:hypothetical protein